jgi:hypothetical protein
MGWPYIYYVIAVGRRTTTTDRALKPHLHYAAGCTTVLYQPDWYKRLDNVNRHIHGCTTGWVFGCKNQTC